ncbi:MAG: tRNA adenosine(34) deaminase TadA [Candidatus Aminicenantes bacterium]|nr:tRNA adenosine(34) deaminase TadA [Candidatus Aminicenantes bacterium]
MKTKTMPDPKKDEYFMRRALWEAEKAAKKGDVPVGAVIVAAGKIISRGHNEPIRRNDPTAHAEISAIRKACRKVGNYRLQNCDLFVTLEPCAMCLGAVIQARIKSLVFGASDPKAGAIVSIMRFPFEKTNHEMDVRGGVLAGECGLILKDFFRSKRA